MQCFKLAWKPMTTPMVSSEVLDTLGCELLLPGGGGGGGGGTATRPVAATAVDRLLRRGTDRWLRCCSRCSAGLHRGARLPQLAIAFPSTPAAFAK